MPRPVDLICGSIHNLEHDRCAGWNAFDKADYENEKLKDEIKRLKSIIRDLQKGIRDGAKKPR